MNGPLLENVRAVFSDVDGVLTDGRLYIGADGAEALKVFHVRDGMAIKRLQRAGILFGVITGRDSEPLRKRMAELGVSEVHTRVPNKDQVLKEILDRKKIPPDAVCYVGDDFNDLCIQQFLQEHL